MTNRDVCEAARRTLLPILVGNTRKAHCLSAHLFCRFGIVSLIFGKPRLWDLFDFSSRTLRLPMTDCERLQVEELIDLAKQSVGYLPILIPCSDQARDLVTRNASLLESHFILSDTEAIFSLPLLATDKQSPSADSHFS